MCWYRWMRKLSLACWMAPVSAALVMVVSACVEWPRAWVAI